MKKIDIIQANSDWGVHIDGASLGPDIITSNLNCEKINKIHKVLIEKKEKEYGKIKLRNLKKVNEFNEKLYSTVSKSLDDGNLPITIGGDHSIVIASALASIKKYENLGVIWVDAHSDFNTSNTTETGNIHGIPLAAITNYAKDPVAYFHNGNFYNFKNTVIVGTRSIDYPGEYNNLKDAGVLNLEMGYVRKEGIDKVMNDAIKLASEGTNGIHLSLDIDVIDPIYAPGVSVPEINGIIPEEFEKVVDIVVKNKDKIKSIDIVEYNPLLDKNKTTLDIAIKCLNKLINGFS